MFTSTQNKPQETLQTMSLIRQKKFCVSKKSKSHFSTARSLLRNWQIIYERHIPEYFGSEIYKVDEKPGSNFPEVKQDKEHAIYSKWYDHSKKDNGKKYVLFWPETMYTEKDCFKRFRPRFQVYAGDENTYADIMLEELDGSDIYIFTFGYKRCDTDRNYLIELITEMYSKTLEYQF